MSPVITDTTMPGWVEELSPGTQEKLNGMRPDWRKALYNPPELHSSQSELFRDACRLHSCGFDDEEREEILTARFADYYRPIEEREIERVIANGTGSRSSWEPSRPRPNPWFIRKAIDRFPASMEWLKARSPQGCLAELKTETIIDRLFPGNPWICMGRSPKDAVTKRREEFRGVEATLPYLVPNPMSARFGETKDGHLSPRCLDNCGRQRYMVIEFDQGTLNEQASLFRFLIEYASIPFALFLFSGNKSLHGWMDTRALTYVEISNARDLALSVGADPATMVPCQLVRTPNAIRDNHNQQTLLYLSSEYSR